MAGLDVNRGAKRAREAREALSLGSGPLGCALATAERAGCAVIVASLPDTVAGACYGASLLWVNGTHPPRRQRFTLAHELGHAWCGHEGSPAPDTVATLSGRTTNPQEIEANAFAAEFLVPRAALQERVVGEPTLEDAARIASDFGVSAIAAVYRLKTLKLGSERRIARLEREIEDGLHEYLGIAPYDDRLGCLEELPYLSPALDDTLLGAALRGDAAVDAATARAIERITRPGRR